MSITPHPATFAAIPSLVATNPSGDADKARYLLIPSDAAPRWVSDPEQATAFVSMREATRMALRLPATLRPFGMLRDIEISARRH